MTPEAPRRTVTAGKLTAATSDAREVIPVAKRVRTKIVTAMVSGSG